MTETVATVLARARGQMAGENRQDAEWLLAHVLDKPPAWLFSHKEQSLSQGHVRLFEQLLHRYHQGEPLAYILGEQPFWTLQLAVTPDVLIPRSDTEVLVETVLKKHPADVPLTLLDAGAGSGAIGLALAVERPQWQVLACDLSMPALQVARVNRERHHLPVALLCMSWLSALADQSLDVLVSNPPYIAAGDSHLPALAHEPLSALVAGEDGLDDIRMIVKQAMRVLKTGGHIYLEHGFDQASAVAATLRRAGLTDVCCVRDYAGHERVCCGTKP